MTYQICTNCVMDSSDSRITFDENGVCDHCQGFEAHVKPNWHTDERGKAQLDDIAEKIRASRNGRDYDSILGMSGGLDSSYLLHIAVKEMGLRPLVFHVDGGWNSRIAVQNIESMTEKLGLHLFTEVINWQEMRELQLAFFRSGVSHLDIPQDMAFLATMYKFAAKHKIKYILNGGNYSTECVRNPLEWIYYGSDMRQVKDIVAKHGSPALKTFPFTSIWYHKIFLRYVRRIQMVRPLNLVPYTKQVATEVLGREYGWEPYGQKHFESRFTAFYEGYWLPTRFGYDTRRVQFSSLILTGQMSREEALAELEEPAYDPDTIHQDLDYIASKLEISVDELNSFHKMPLKSYRNYKNQAKFFEIGSRVLQTLRLEGAVKR